MDSSIHLMSFNPWLNKQLWKEKRGIIRNTDLLMKIGLRQISCCCYSGTSLRRKAQPPILMLSNQGRSEFDLLPLFIPIPKTTSTVVTPDDRNTCDVDNTNSSPTR